MSLIENADTALVERNSLIMLVGILVNSRIVSGEQSTLFTAD
jgi:hypothetical protein